MKFRVVEEATFPPHLLFTGTKKPIICASAENDNFKSRFFVMFAKKIKPATYIPLRRF